MRDSSHPHRLIRLPRARFLVIATLVSAVLVAGCGGSSHSPTAATVRAAITSRLTTAAGRGAASSRTTAQGASGSGPLALAKCMRANGVPNFPDPNAGGGARFQIPTGSNPAAPAFKAAQAKCQKLILDGGAGPAFSEQSLVEVRKVAVCMRAHGISEFPDPKRAPTGRLPSVPAGVTEITDYDGALLEFPATLNMQSPAYKQAAAACGALAQKLGNGPH